MMGINYSSDSDSMRFVGTSNMHSGLMDKVRGMTTSFHHKAKDYGASFLHKTEYIAGPAMQGMNALTKATVEATKTVAKAPVKAVRAVAPKVGGTRAVKTTPKTPRRSSKPRGGSIKPPRAKKSRTRPKRQADRRAKRAKRQARNVRKARGRRPVPRGRVKSIAYMVPSGDDEINFVGVGGIDS